VLRNKFRATALRELIEGWFAPHRLGLSSGKGRGVFTVVGKVVKKFGTLLKILTAARLEQ
jgi:hypothetical protein